MLQARLGEEEVSGFKQDTLQDYTDEVSQGAGQRGSLHHGIGKPKPGTKLQYFGPPRQGGGVAGDIAVCEECGMYEGCRGRKHKVPREVLSWSGAPELQVQAGERHPMVHAVLGQCCCHARGCKVCQLALSACDRACTPGTHLLMQLS